MITEVDFLLTLGDKQPGPVSLRGCLGAWGRRASCRRWAVRHSHTPAPAAPLPAVGSASYKQSATRTHNSKLLISASSHPSLPCQQSAGPQQAASPQSQRRAQMAPGGAAGRPLPLARGAGDVVVRGMDAPHVAAVQPCRQQQRQRQQQQHAQHRHCRRSVVGCSGDGAGAARPRAGRRLLAVNCFRSGLQEERLRPEV